MRIISGKYRGRALVAPLDYTVRPTIDRVKESIFNVIQFGIEGSRFVDLFAGTGSMGVEAISRGASEVIFSDNAVTSLDIVKRNLKGIEGNYKIVNRSYKDSLNSISGKVDYIFVDAPYALDCIYDICSIVKSKDILNENGYIIYEHDEDREYHLDNEYYVAKQKTFGKVVVDYICLAKRVCAITGSFDPITMGHMFIVDTAYKKFDKIVLLIAQNENKENLFTLKQRLKIARHAVQDLVNVYVDVCEGFLYEYLNEHHIETIMRGYRTLKDYDYEVEMAQYNKEHGGITTLLVQADSEEASISSTTVRNALKNNENIKGLVPKNAVKTIEKLYEETKK